MVFFYWDKIPVESWLIDCLLSMSKNQVIWGGNYYYLPPSRCWLVWNKLNGTNDFADCEIAWTNFDMSIRKIDHLWNGMIRKNHEGRFHPTQKPLNVIKWALSLCPNNPQTIIDPFMGSGTTLRAAKDLNKRAIGIEIEERYCELAAARMSQEVLQF
jgi:DNA methylase